MQLLRPHQRREAQCGSPQERALFLARALTGCDTMPAAILLHHLRNRARSNFPGSIKLMGKPPRWSGTWPVYWARGPDPPVASLRFSEDPSGTFSLPSLDVVLNRV